MSHPRAPIAIIGLAGTFAQATDLQAYWGNILDEVDCITEVPDTRWSVADYYDPDPKAPDKTYCRHGGFIPDQDFNPLAFGLPPNILDITDVAQLLALVIARQALTDAGYGDANPHAENTGVVLGVSALTQITPLVSRLQYPVWTRALRNRGVAEADTAAIVETIKRAYIDWREDAFPGYLSNVVAGRIANRLDLGGVNCSVDAACASSMASLQMAMDELGSHRADMMIAGGVDTNNTIMAYLSFSKTPAFTAHDHMRPFDADSDGMLIGEGVGMLVLRRLEDAEREGNRIYAVVKGMGASSDGKYKSIYAPRMEGQELALRRAYRDADCLPSSVALIEAHGTGTAAGDPTEVAALRRVFGDGVEDRGRVALGSVKSQIGHTKVAAGAASLIKAALALHHKVLPPTINVSTPHPALRLDASPFYLNTRTRPWFSQGPRRAGVSSFGFGGTNFHVVLEEHGSQKPETARLHTTPFAIFLHAPDGEALRAACAQASAVLRSPDGEAHWRSLIRASKQDGLPPDAARVGFLAGSIDEAAARLDHAVGVLRVTPEVEAFTDPSGIHYRRRGMDTQGRVVALFPGQGSQYLDMGRSLCLHFPAVQQAYAEMDAVLVRGGLGAISDVVFPPPVFDPQTRDTQSRTLRLTQHAQAAIGAFSLGVYKVLQHSGFAPDFVAGHSLGEVTALHAAGAISEPDYLGLLVARGQAMARPAAEGLDAGTLLAVHGDAGMLEHFVAGHAGVSVANRNSTSQLVVAGSRQDLDVLKSELAALGNAATWLPVSAAFHSPRVAHAQAPFAEALDGIVFSPARIPVYSNATGDRYPDAPDAVRRLLADHLVSPVNFRQEIERLYAHGGRVFVECGPGGVLTGLVHSILAGEPHVAIAMNARRSDDSDGLLRDGYVQLRVAGVPLTDIDPYQARPDASVRTPGLTVRLNGAAYVSETTQALRATDDRYDPVTQVVQAEHIMSDSEQQRVLEQTVTLTGDTSARAHHRYLENMADYSAQYVGLMHQLLALINSPQSTPGVLELFERGIGRFHEQQAMAQQVHAQYLKNQVEWSQRLVQAPSDPMTPAPPAILHAAVRPAPVLAPAPPQPRLPPTAAVVTPAFTPSPALAPVPASASASVATPASLAVEADDIAALLIAVISDKTGYPVETLDVSMDLDSDLGVDSLKRVEIMAALEGKLFSSLAGLNFEHFAELRTIGQIAAYLAGAAHRAPA